MTGHISIVPAGGTWVVRAGGAVLAESKAALELSEGSAPVVIYFPRGDIAMPFLDRTATASTCPHKGIASYYSIVTKSTTIRDAAWSYETPVAGMERIAGHLAFYPAKVTVERL